MERTEILVIGAGIAGCSVARMLAKAGAEVMLIDRHDPMTQASGSNAGSLHLQIPITEFRQLGETWAEHFAAVIPMMREAIGMWADMDEALGVDIEMVTAGGLIVAHDDNEMELVQCKAVIERRAGLDVRILSRSELRDLAPYVNAGAVGGALCAGEGKANPLIAGPALVRAAEQAGARLRRKVALEGLQTEGSGFVARTSAGDISAGRVVNCAGAETSRIAVMLGLEFAIEALLMQVNVTEPVAPLIPHLVYAAAGRLTLKQTRLGALIIGGGWPATRDAQGRPAVSPASVAGNLAVALSVVPQLAGISVLRSWPSVVNGTADWYPILGEVPSVPGFHMCMFPWSGFTGGPMAARLVADNLMGKRPPAAYRPFFLS